MKIHTPKSDYMFKKIFGKKGNEDILKDLLISILKIDIKQVERRKAELRRKKILDDNTRMYGAREKGIILGIKRGIEQGVAQGIEYTAKKMLLLRFDIKKYLK